MPEKIKPGTPVRQVDGPSRTGMSVDTRTAGQVQAEADRAEIARLVRMTDAEREAHYLASNRNMLRMVDDAQAGQ